MNVMYEELMRFKYDYLQETVVKQRAFANVCLEYRIREVLVVIYSGVSFIHTYVRVCTQKLYNFNRIKLRSFNAFVYLNRENCLFFVLICPKLRQPSTCKINSKVHSQLSLNSMFSLLRDFFIIYY